MKINELQRVAVEESRLGIPILFAYDTIHGYRTIFPIPLGAASSFDPAVAAADHRIGARESAAVGLKQIYSPMVDVSHEPRWGRIAEAGGEDPYLNSVFAAARVKAAQGSDYSAPDKVVTSVKHYAAYGQPEGGRDYDTTDMSEQRLRNLYLPPFKAAIDAGVGHRDVLVQRHQRRAGLREPLPRDGHAQARVGLRRLHRERLHRRRRAARVPAEDARRGPLRPRRRGGRPGRGRGGAERRHRLGDGQHQHPRLRQAAAVAAPDLDPARSTTPCAGSCAIKFRAGLFENPYVDVEAAQLVAPTAATRAAARKAAGRSMVLLKNEGDPATLPLDPSKNTAVIGPLADNQHDMLGPWWGRGVDDRRRQRAHRGSRRRAPAR